MSKEIDLGLGIEFDKATLNQLDAIVTKIKEIQKKIDSLSNVQEKYTKSVEKSKEVNEEVKKYLANIEQKSGEWVKTQERINKTGSSITNTYKGLNNTLTTVTKKFNEQGDLINYSVRTSTKLKGSLDGIAGVLAHNVTKMMEWAVAGTLLFGTIRILQSSFQQLMQMETEAINIAKVLPKGTDISSLELAAVTGGKKFGEDIREIERAMQSWARQYKDVNDIIRQTNASLLAATATDISFETSVRSLSAIMAEWNMETEKSIHVVDVLNEMSNNYRVTAEELAVALEKTGSGARAAGITFEELTGILTTGIQTLGLTGEEVGTMWSRVMARIRGNKEAKKAFEDLGIDVAQSLSDILNDLMVKWDIMTKAQKANFAITVAGTHHWSKFVGIMDNFNTVIEATADSYFSFNSAQEEVDLMLSTTQKHLDQLYATWQEFLHRNKAVLSTVKDVANIFKTVLTGINNTNSSLLKTVVILGSVATVVLTLRGAYLKAKAASDALTVSQWALNTAMSPLMSIVGILGSLGVAFYLAGKNSAELSNKIEDINVKIEGLNQEIQGHINNIRGLDDLGKKYEKLRDAIEEAKNKGQDYAKLEEKLSIVKEKLITQIADGNEEYENQLRKSDSLTDFYNMRIKQELDLANAIQERIKQQKQEQIDILEKEKQPILEKQVKLREKILEAEEALKKEQKTPFTVYGGYRIKNPWIAYYENLINKLKTQDKEFDKIVDKLKEQQDEFKKQILSMKPITIKSVFAETELGGFEEGDDLEKKIIFALKDLSETEIREIENVTKKISDKLIEQGVELEESVNKWAIFDKEGKIHVFEIKADTKVLSYVENLFSKIKSLAKEITFDIKELNDAFVEVAIKSNDEWQKFLDTLYEIPGVLKEIDKIEDIYRRKQENYRQIEERAFTQLEQFKKRKQEIEIQIEDFRSKGIPLEDSKLLQELDSLEKAISLLEQTISNSRFMTSYTEEELKTVRAIKEAFSSLIAPYRAISKAESEYQRAIDIAKISGIEMDKATEKQLRENILKAYKEYIFNLQLLRAAYADSGILVDLINKEIESSINKLAKWSGTEVDGEAQKQFNLIISSLNKFIDTLAEADEGLKDFTNVFKSFINSLELSTSGKIEINFEKLTGDLVISLVSMLTNAFINIFKDYTSQYNKFQESGFSVYETMRNFKDYNENLAQLNDLYRQKGFNTIAGAGAGALAGFLVAGPIGALVGALFGGFFGGSANNIDQKIKELEEKLGATLQKVKEVLGTAIEDVASGLANAFQSVNYYEFSKQWANNVEQMTRDALIKAFLAQEIYQGLYKNLSDTITYAVMDGVISSSEIASIKQLYRELQSVMRPLYQSLSLVDTISPWNNTSSSVGNYTAGTLSPVTYNIYISVNSTAFMGDKDDARELALMVGDILHDELGRI